MKSKLFSTLLFVVVFALAISSMYAQNRAFGTAHIAVTLENPGPGNTVVIGTKVKVVLQDPDIGLPTQIASATADFSQFGSLVANTTMVWDAVASRWKAEYTVLPGLLNGTARVTITGTYTGGGGQILPDNDVFTINNNAAAIGALDITTTVTNPGTGGYAIVGSTIQVTFTSAIVASASVNFSDFGGGTVAMTKTGTTFTASYVVVAGSINGSFKTSVIAFEGANPNPGVATDNDFTFINNYVPTETSILAATHLEVNGNPALAFMKIGDAIHVVGSLATTGATIVNKVWIDWGQTFTGGTIVEYAVTAGAFRAVYTPDPGALPVNTLNLQIKIVKLQTTVGNISLAAWAGKWVSKNGSGTDIQADLIPPSVVGVRDLWYDLSKPLRFSPITTLVDTYNTAPNDFKIFLTIPNWGAADGTKSFTLRFTSENRATFNRTYSFTDAPATVTASGGDLYIIWDGKDDLGNIVAQSAQTTYGVTLWAIQDGVGNSATLSHILGDEFSPTGVYNAATHYTIYQGGATYTGTTILNRIHVVADNSALTITQNVTPQGYPVFTAANPIHLVRLINDVNNNATWDAGESIVYSNAAGVVGENTLNFSFQLQRSNPVDTNPLRHEEGKYWTVIESGASKWYYNGATWVTYAGFDQAVNSLPITFTGNSTSSSVMNFSWNTSSIATFPGAATTPTPYKLYAYFQDNAGNIVKSQEVNVKIEHRYFHIPIINDINIISQHNGGATGLAVGPANLRNFYLTSAYAAGDDYTGNYYVSQDTVRIEILINDRDYLRANQSVKIEAALGGTIPATIWLNQADFWNNPNPLLPDRALVNLVVNNMASTSGSTLGTTWTVGGGVAAPNYIRVLSYPLATNPFVTEYGATDNAQFKLVIPEKPVWPSNDLADYVLTATPDVFSPGNPINTYDANTNPANDNVLDDTNFSFTIPASNRNLTWTLRLERLAGTLIKSWTGNLTSAQLPYTSAAYNFNGLLDNLDVATAATATESFNLKLAVQPAAYTDLGYLAPPSTVVPTKVVTIDNTNPTLVNGAGSTIAANKVITLLPSQPTPVVTETQQQVSFTLHTNEFLPISVLNSVDPIAPANQGSGWNIQVLDSLGVVLTNAGNPVTATISGIIGSDGAVATGYKTFAITATLGNVGGDFTAKNAKLHIRLPWDKAKNPARYNSPTYPYNSDLYYNDSAEGYLTIHILNAKPLITDITFTNKTVTGNAGYVSGSWNTAVNQAWVRDGGTPAGNFTMVATVTGGAYRALNTTWTANLQALLGGTGNTNAAVVPTATSTINPLNELRVWTLTWTGTIPAAVATPWTNGQSLSVPITIVTTDGSNPAAHTETKSITILVDKAIPVVSTATTQITADGTAQALNFTVTDTPGSGIYWNTIVANPYGYTGESLVLTPNTGITVTDTGNGTFTVQIPANSAVKYFNATYTVQDNMGNSTTYNRYINVVPIPVISNVTIVGVTGYPEYFVPGTNMTVNWTLANYQRATSITVALSAPGVNLAAYTQTITDFSAVPANGAMSYTFNNVNIAGLDGKVITATVTGFTTGYTAPTANATSNINLISGSDTVTADTRPIISSVVFKLGGNVINTLVPTMTGVEIVATVTTVSNLNVTTFPMSITMNGVNGSFNLPANPTIVTSGNTRTYTWTGVSFANLTWTPDVPDLGYKIANFKFNCRTIYGYQYSMGLPPANVEYSHEMAVMNLPITAIQGMVNARTPYAGTDPNGWFAPEHTLRTLYTFVSTVDAAVPPITADFDLIEDNIVANLQAPMAVGATGSTKTPRTITLTRTSGNVSATVYVYIAKWITNPDEQSIWSAYEDGASIPINFVYQQMTGAVADTRSIKVDKKVPLYDVDQLWVATGTTTPGTYQFINNGFTNLITLALNIDGTWPTTPSTQKIYVKYRAKDGNGVGVIDVATPTLTGWTVAHVSQTPVAGQPGTVEKVISLTPNTPSAINATTRVNLTLAAVQDSVGHLNYEGVTPVHSTDPAWLASLAQPLRFGFSANYLTNLDYARGYQYVVRPGIVNPRLDDYTAPYVRPDNPTNRSYLGFKMKLAAPQRGVDVQSISVSGIDLNTAWVTNPAATAAAPTWTPLTLAADGSYYLSSNIAISPSYTNGQTIKYQYRVNYTIIYTDNSPSYTSYVSQEINNLVTVDAVSPAFVNVPTGSGVQIWSGSLGVSQEGYVVAHDNDGVLQIKFTDIAGYYNSQTVPTLQVTNLNQFVSTKNGTAMVSPYTVKPYDLTWNAGVWTAYIDSLNIVVPNPVTNSVTIGYTVTDVVNNTSQSGNRMVEVVVDGPIVPIIRNAQLVTSGLNSTPSTVTNYLPSFLATGVTSELQMFIDAQQLAYIESVWVNPVTGVTFGTPTFVEDLNPNNDYKWVAHIPVLLPAAISQSTINFVVNTKRYPFGASEVFEDNFTVPVIVDGNSYTIGTGTKAPYITATLPLGYGPVTGTINPAVGAVITTKFYNIRELIGDVVPPIITLPANIASWFTLQNTVPAAFTTIPTPVVTVDADTMTVVWTFNSADISQTLAEGVNQLSVNFKYKNVYGLEKTSPNFSFYLDRKPPVIAANGIKLYDAANAQLTPSYNFNSAAYIANSQDWKKVRFEFTDPIIVTGVNGTGVNNATVTFTREAETYATPALTHVAVTSLTSNYIELSFTDGYTAFDLAEGYYNFNIQVEDNIKNNVNYTQRLLYQHAPTTMTIFPAANSSVNVMKADGTPNQVQVTAFPYDNGQVQGVHFFLYQDVNNNGTYEAAIDIDRSSDLGLSSDLNPDMQSPYTVMWNFTGEHYKYLVDNTLPNPRNNTRKFLLRAAAISESRSVSDEIVVINVVDNQPAVPNVPTYVGAPVLYFNYQTPSANQITLRTTFTNWRDADLATFVVKNSSNAVIATLPAIVEAGVADTVWNYNGLTPGNYTVTVTGRDFVNNTSAPIAMALPITINDPASLVTYGLTMTNVIGFNNEPVIPSGTIFGGTVRPVTGIGDLRLDAVFANAGNGLLPLDGIASMTFKAWRYKFNPAQTLPDSTLLTVPNNTILQPDYDGTGTITVTPQIQNGRVSIFVPDSFFMPADYAVSDYTYKFFIQLTPVHPAILQPVVYSNLRVDYYAPRVTIANNSPSVTWSQTNFFKVTGDVTDFNTIVMKWSTNGTTWNDAVYGNRETHTLVSDVPNYTQFNNWNTAGGSVNTLLDYNGVAQVKFVATDAMGNIRESNVVSPWVDNKAPNTPISQVAYRSVPVEGQTPAQATAYNTLHTPGTLTGETANTITVMTSSQDYGTTNLRLRVDPAAITGLGNNTTHDYIPPVRLYHGYSATGNVNNIAWTNGVLYAFDHDGIDMNGSFGFDLPSNLIHDSGTHYFILGTSDARGNVEGDQASLTTAFDGSLSASERIDAIDLTVNVVNIADVQMEITNPSVDNKIVGEWLNLAANVTGNAGNVVVNQVRFERKVGNNWTTIATVNRADASNLKFHLFRKDIPQFDGIPYVPGVHLYANGAQVTEMVWNATDQSWEATSSFTQGNYNFKYYLDLNNDGIISSLDLDAATALNTPYIIDDPNGFTSFNVTPWVTPLDTQAIPAGLYEFRAVPLNATGTALFNQISPSRWIHIDNTAPNTTITLIGAVQRIRPIVDQVTIVADVNDLLVATDDIIKVTYQYSSQPATASFRRWVNIDPAQTNMNGNYQKVWSVVTAPIADLVDNDDDGLVDEADEADATYYLRAVAYDLAGNYFTSNIYTLAVDGSASQMLVDRINNVVMNSTNNIFVMPATGAVTVTASNATLAGFDNPVSVRFEYKYSSTVNPQSWGGWQSFDAVNPWVSVTNGSASQNLPNPMEGYYAFRAISKDILGNIDAEAPITYVVFNDVTGSNANITRVGTRNIVSGSYGFAQNVSDYAGTIVASIDPLITDIRTLTFEYGNSAIGPWTNINTIAVTQGQVTANTNWIPPTSSNVPYLYLRVVAQDTNGNNQSTQTVKLYLDTTAPNAIINSLTHTVVNGLKVINKSDSLLINLSYQNLPATGVVDVASATVKIINAVSNLTIAEVYANVNQASQNFTFSSNNMATLPNGIYRLELVLTDFAGNTATILPAAYQALYIDTMAPANLSIASTSHPNYEAVYNTSAINFSVNYTDLIGINNAGALTATFTYMNVSDVVSTYTLTQDTVTNNKYVNFVWNPSTAMEQFIINGETNIFVSAEVKVKDALNQEASVPILTNPNFFKLTYGIPNATRMMAVTDVVNGIRTTHFVNWNLATPQVVELLGTNHTPGAVAEPLELFAYVPHLTEIPTSVIYEYRLVGSTAWNAIATVAVGDAWDFIDPSFLNQYQRQYSANWNIASLITGAYEVRTTSTYASGNSDSVIRVNIYNGNLIPQVSVTGMQAGNVQRGETYTLTSPTFIGNSSLLSSVVYKYRYVTVANNVVSPTSQWMNFGDVNGTPVTADIYTPYSFNWTIYPYYLYNNTVQIVGFAKDKWGTETPISTLISNNAYAIAKIIDTVAPVVPAITVTWNGTDNPAWLSGIAINGVTTTTATAKAKVTTNINPNDLARVEIYYNDVLIGTDTAPTLIAPTATDPSYLLTQAYPFTISTSAAVISGVVKVMAYDVYNNVSTTLKTINIDNTLPTANLAATVNGTPITTLERESNVLLNATPADTPAGIQKVEYAYAYTTTLPANLVWLPIGTAVTAAPWTTQWLVPANLEFGHDYIVRATVTDLVGHTVSVENTYEVSDINTNITIVSVAGHSPVNDIIPVRLHGDFEVVTNVPAGQNIPRLEWLIRSAGSTNWRLLAPAHLSVLNYVATDTLNLNNLPTGDYDLGVAPAERILANPVDQVRITVDNTFTINGVTSIPATNGMFNGEKFVVNFSVASDDEILENQVTLSYAYPIDPTTWYSLGNADLLTTLNGIAYTATFNQIEIMHNNQINDGYYLFRVGVADRAIPAPNSVNVTVATNVLYDTTLPNVTLTAINGITDLLLPVNINLGTNAAIDAAAFDILGGQAHNIASGIQKVEFYYNHGANDNVIDQNSVLIGQDTAAPYSINWNTLGYTVGSYTVIAKAFDNANNTAMIPQNVSIVAPTNLQPYALITAMDFDVETADQDEIYAVVNTWANETVNSVTFEYFNGTAWTGFAQATQMTGYWKAQFNAELMTNVVKVRTVINYNDNLTSALKPEMVVAYNAANGGSLVTSPTITAGVYYNNTVRVMNVPNTPIVTTMFNGNYVGMPAVQMVNGNQTADFAVNAHGAYTFWAAVLDNTGNIQLAKTGLNTYNIGTVTDAPITVTVPASSFVYFETVQPTVALPTGFNGLSVQKAVLASPMRNLTYTVALNATPATQGTIIGMYYNGTEWINATDTIVNTNNTVTFSAPSGYIYAVAQYTGVTINTMFSSVAPQYITPAPANVTWTLTNTQIKFLVYTGMNQGGYETPAVGEFEYQMYLDNMLVLDNVTSNYTDGYVTYNASGLTAGAHTARIVATKNGFTAFAEKIFNVETTSPVIVAIGTQLTVQNRTITATITDTQTGIQDVSIFVPSMGGTGISMNIPLENLVVNGNVYSYTFTMDDLNNIGYDVNYNQPMVATWHASNNLELSSSTEPINYTVNIEGPAIAFTGFSNGLWLNPSVSTPLTFTVTVPTGRVMPADGVYVYLEEVTPDGYNEIQTMTLAPVSVAGNVYSYSLIFGQPLVPTATAIRMTVEAIDNYNVWNDSQQTYGIDLAAPVAWALAPIGDPIDNDGDGLFNEDPINGVNNDLDWVDLNQNGFWDADEPQIVDEDPIDYYSAVIPQGTTVVVALAFEDYRGSQYLLPSSKTKTSRTTSSSGSSWYFTGASGIDEAHIAVTLNGTAITGTITEGNFTHNAGILAAGHYTVVASIPDFVGNVGSLAYEFDVVGGAPTVTFNPINGNWWLNSTNTNNLGFTVESESALANGGVVANLYTMPDNNLLQGPITVTPSNNSYSVALLGGIVPANASGVRLEVIATDVWGGSSTSNQVYGIDNMLPLITLITPAVDAQFAFGTAVNITATISDQAPVRSGSKNSASQTSKDRSGSGIQSVVLNVVNPDGTNAVTETYPANTQAIAKVMTTSQYGTYYINVTATDGAANLGMVTRSFVVSPAAAPAITFVNIPEWLNTNGANNLSFTVDSPVAVTAVANVYAQPSGALLMGPLTVVPQTGIYTVVLNGAMIPMGQTSVQLNVKVTNQFGGITETNQFYNVDKTAPAIVFHNPVIDAQIIKVDATTKVLIDAEFPDVNPGSGILKSELKVFNPLNAQVGATIETGAGVTTTHNEIDNLMLGTYTIRLTVWDMAGNQTTQSITFNVIAAPLPPADLAISDAHIYPNPVASGSSARFALTLTSGADVSVRIYDFAGREVRSLSSAKFDAKSKAVIEWDGRNNDGEKLARGTYFARVIANDGKKIVEKVVKVAIIK